ncbi:hypothetical protein HAX54_004020, partial [Datura stramonium]|nr:hypothetical protein [Datura stramonium]
LNANENKCKEKEKINIETQNQYEVLNTNTSQTRRANKQNEVERKQHEQKQHKKDESDDIEENKEQEHETHIVESNANQKIQAIHDRGISSYVKLEKKNFGESREFSRKEVQSRNWGGGEKIVVQEEEGKNKLIEKSLAMQDEGPVMNEIEANKYIAIRST